MTPSVSTSVVLTPLTCHPDGVVAEQRVAVGEPARVDARVLVRHVDDAQHPLAEPRPVAGHQSGAVFEPDHGLRGVVQLARHLQRFPHAQDKVLQEGCLTGHGVCTQRRTQGIFRYGLKLKDLKAPQLNLNELCHENLNWSYES